MPCSCLTCFPLVFRCHVSSAVCVCDDRGRDDSLVGGLEQPWTTGCHSCEGGSDPAAIIKLSGQLCNSVSWGADSYLQERYKLYLPSARLPSGDRSCAVGGEGLSNVARPTNKQACTIPAPMTVQDAATPGTTHVLDDALRDQCNCCAWLLPWAYSSVHLAWSCQGVTQAPAAKT